MPKPLLCSSNQTSVLTNAFVMSTLVRKAVFCALARCVFWHGKVMTDDSEARWPPAILLNLAVPIEFVCPMDRGSATVCNPALSPT